MQTRMFMAIAALSTALVAGGVQAQPSTDERVDFATGQAMPGTLSLHASDTGRNARLTPVRDKYRPKLVFGDREVVCMIRFAPGVDVIAPGGSGEVMVACTEPVSVMRAGAHAIVRDGGKDVGHVDIRLPSSDPGGH